MQTRRLPIGRTGKRKNCREWALYEYPGESETAAICNGGDYNGHEFAACPSKLDCRRATLESREHDYQGPQMNPAKPYGTRSGGGSRVVAGTIKDLVQPKWKGDWSLQTTIPTKKGKGKNEREVPLVPPPKGQEALPYYQLPPELLAHLARPVEPPEDFPKSMQSQYLMPRPVPAMGVTPTFLPAKGESTWSRLGKNVVQGAIGSTGWHIFDFARSVDFFGR